MKTKYLDDKCLDLYRQCVRVLWHNRCAHENNLCGFIGDRQILEGHHLIPRVNKVWRHDPVNGILLCPFHHGWAEANPILFDEWLRDHWPVSHKWVKDNKYAKLASPLWEIHYVERAAELKETLEYLKSTHAP